MAMGILAVFDMAGVDVGVKARRANPDRQPKDDPTFYRASQVLFDQGWLGQKSGKGYYRYEAGSRERLQHDEALKLLAAEGRRLGVARSEPISARKSSSAASISMINEGATHPGRGRGAAAGRHRRGLHRRLWLSAPPRRADVLRRRDRPGYGARGPARNTAAGPSRRTGSPRRC